MARNIYEIDNVAWSFELEGTAATNLPVAPSLSNKEFDALPRDERKLIVDAEHQARRDYSDRLSHQIQKPVQYFKDYYKWDTGNWVIVPDNTIKPTRAGLIDIEIKTPVWGENCADLDILPDRLQAIADSGLTSEGLCALHLHTSSLNEYLSGDCSSSYCWHPWKIKKLYHNFMANRDDMEKCLGQRLVGTDRARHNPVIEKFADYEARDMLVNRICPPQHFHLDRDERYSEQRQHQLNLMPLYPLDSVSSKPKGTVEFRLMLADDYVTASPYIRMFLALTACSIRGYDFVLADYAETVAHDPRFALPKMPRRRRLLKAEPA